MPLSPLECLLVRLTDIELVRFFAQWDSPELTMLSRSNFILHCFVIAYMRMAWNPVDFFGHWFSRPETFFT
jgi:hypothetical protein